MAERRLFDEFPPVSTEAWEEQIRADLGGSSYDERLLWRPGHELTLRPYYRAEDLGDLPHLHPAGDVDDVPIQSTWSIQQNVRVLEVAEARRQLRDALEGGVDVLGVVLGPASSVDDLPAVLDGLDLEGIGLHVDAGLSSLACLEALLESTSGTLPLTAAFDPLAELARTGRFSPASMDEAARDVGALPPQVRALQASATVFHEAGAGLIDETALLLGAVSEYMAALVERNRPPAQALEHLFVQLPIGPSYFLEIARMRAVRLLLQQVIGAYDADLATAYVPIHATLSRRNMTLYDPHSNLLRATTEAASAVVGGCDVLVVHPYDAVSGNPSDFALRLSRNLQHLLRHEANMDRVDDPAAGSYYVEVLTDAVGRAAWQRFQEIEQRGGLIEAIRQGFVRQMVSASRERLLDDVALREYALVGTNLYPDTDERRLDASRHPPPSAAASAGPAHLVLSRAPKGAPARIAGPFEPVRAAEPFESLRLRTERYAARSGRRPSASIIPIGEPSVRTARAAFAADVLACAGLGIHMNDGFDAPEEAAAVVVDADLLVLAGPDTCYTSNVLHDIKLINRLSIIGIVSRQHVDIEADFLLYGGADVVRILTNVQAMLGMEVEA